jgi:hypothetical protein
MFIRNCLAQAAEAVAALAVVEEVVAVVPDVEAEDAVAVEEEVDRKS